MIQRLNAQLVTLAPMLVQLRNTSVDLYSDVHRRCKPTTERVG